jgi:hypothetical protein
MEVFRTELLIFIIIIVIIINNNINIDYVINKNNMMKMNAFVAS